MDFRARPHSAEEAAFLASHVVATGPDGGAVTYADLEAANRELMEEAGYGARELTHLRDITLAPVYMSHATHLVLARDLYPQRLAGDEPEELEIVPWKLDDIGQLILREEFSEGRSVAALFIVREWLKQQR